ncbi:uncharacterized protein LAESUDRAFT_716476 [Laetiporus sulphureus 93-53]|uniref:Uncharacterized protein n=1 Tax=Laetiporus sulphureus 93-53 TaxID=1314785 RepID=A0A165CMY7_9APHY|nr:uncharacterized protein LAESUDRAFT_716476 [Laetiporus sulphureus 93-53]KZT03104.1 hypothetical protein LAESUDRAFT_716476 [Laetiporus sulphureus 93-53]
MPSTSTFTLTLTLTRKDIPRCLRYAHNLIHASSFTIVLSFAFLLGCLRRVRIGRWGALSLLAARQGIVEHREGEGEGEGEEEGGDCLRTRNDNRIRVIAIHGGLILRMDVRPPHSAALAIHAKEVVETATNVQVQHEHGTLGNLNADLRISEGGRRPVKDRRFAMRDARTVRFTIRKAVRLRASQGQSEIIDAPGEHRGYERSTSRSSRSSNAPRPHVHGQRHDAPEMSTRPSSIPLETSSTSTVQHERDSLENLNADLETAAGETVDYFKTVESRFAMRI